MDKQPSVSEAQVGKLPGINANMLTRWERELSQNGSKVFFGQGHALDEEMAALKRELNRGKKERDFCAMRQRSLRANRSEVLHDRSLSR